MINYTYQLVSPEVFSVKYTDVDLKSCVLIRPKYMAICHADQRYYLGKREHKVLKAKLPMALIHECCAEVVHDPTNCFSRGELVVPIPNVPPQGVYEEFFENYVQGTRFLSSGYDGFMREYIDMPGERLVSVQGIPPQVAAITEFVSVAVHAVHRFELLAHSKRDIIGIWGDGSLAYCVATVLKMAIPNAQVVVVGKNIRKLAHFSFVNHAYLADSVPKEMELDHAFECCGGEGSYYAIDDIIRHIRPQGSIMLMGVSENKISINTRDILEKGLSLIGNSRSGKVDFLHAIEMLKTDVFQQRIKSIIYEDDKVSSVEDMHRVFRTDLNTTFKTVFEWNL